MVDSYAYLGVVFSSGDSFQILNPKPVNHQKSMHQLLQLLDEIDTPINIALRFYYTILYFLTSFEKTEAIFDRIWVVVPRYAHTLSLNNKHCEHTKRH